MCATSMFHWSPLICSFSHRLSYPHSHGPLEADDPSDQTANSRLMLCRNARVTHVLSSRTYLSISRHLAKHGEYSTVGYFGAGHIHLPFITVYCYSRPIVSVVTLLLCLLYKVNLMAGSAWTRKSPVYVGFVSLRDFRHPLGVSDHGPCR